MWEPSTATPSAAAGSGMKLWLGELPSRLARPIAGPMPVLASLVSSSELVKKTWAPSGVASPEGGVFGAERVAAAGAGAVGLLGGRDLGGAGAVFAHVDLLGGAVGEEDLGAVAGDRVVGAVSPPPSGEAAILKSVGCPLRSLRARTRRRGRFRRRSSSPGRPGCGRAG